MLSQTAAARAVVALLLLGWPVACGHRRAAGADPVANAQKLLADGRPEEARRELVALHAVRPEDLTVARLLVHASVQAGRTEQLLGELAGRPPSAASHFMRGLALFSRAADANAAVVTELEAAIALSPRSAELPYRLGIALVESERFEQALAPLRSVSTLDPARTDVYLPLAKALYRTGKPEEAVAALSKMLQGTPSQDELRVARALMDHLSDPFADVPQQARPKLESALAWLHEVDVPQQAITTLEEVLRDYPDLALAHALLGLAHQRLDDAGRALEEFKRAAALAPRDARPHVYLGTLYLSRQRADAAREAFEQALARDPLSLEVRQRLGELAAERGDLPTAREHLRVRTLLEPKSPAAKVALAQVLLLQGQSASAEQTLMAALTDHPEAVEVKLRLGLLYADRSEQASGQERQRARTEAKRYLRQVLDAQPDNALASRVLQALAKP